MKKTGRYKTHRVKWLVAGALLLVVTCLTVGFVMTNSAGAPKSKTDEKTGSTAPEVSSQKTNARVLRMSSQSPLDTETARLKSSPMYTDRSLQPIPKVDWAKQDLVLADVSIPTYMTTGAATVEGNEKIIINLTMPPKGCMYTQDNHQIVFFVAVPKGDATYSVFQRIHENTATCEQER